MILVSDAPAEPFSKRDYAPPDAESRDTLLRSPSTRYATPAMQKTTPRIVK